jgi:hypothetical protein
MPDTKMPKPAGEHWVCSVLARPGWAVALTGDGLERTDILAVDTTSTDRHTVEVQVKTASPGTERFFIGAKANPVDEPSENEWWVLVGLKDPPHVGPRSFILPATTSVLATGSSTTGGSTIPPWRLGSAMLRSRAPGWPLRLFWATRTDGT